MHTQVNVHNFQAAYVKTLFTQNWNTNSCWVKRILDVCPLQLKDLYFSNTCSKREKKSIIRAVLEILSQSEILKSLIIVFYFLGNK